MADQMRPTPRNSVLGLFSDIVNLPLQYMSSPERTQQMQGTAQFLYGTGIPKTLERMSYGDSLFSGAGGLGGTTRMRPETAEALMNVAPFAPAAGRLASRAVRATEGMPVGMSIKDVGKSAITREGNPIQSAVVLVGDKIFMGRTHGDALNRAVYEGVVRKEGGKYIFPKGAEVNSDLFMTKDGQIIDRLQASKMFDIGASETAIEKGLMQNNPPKSMTVDSYIEEATALKKQREQSPYPQQAALDLAQQRAALPVEQGGLGLPANNTAADRAKAMGFDTNVLHGSPNPNIKQFDPMMAGVNTNNAFDNNIFATTSPESATGYALNWEHYRNQIKTSPEYKAINREENALLKDLLAYKESGNDKGVSDVNAKMDLLSKQRENIYNNFLAGKLGSQGSTIYPLIVRSKDFLPYEASGAGWMRANRPAIDAAEQAGYSGALIKNVKDNAGANLGSIADVYATPDPTRFRSRFAAFDPFRKDVATATAMGVALPDLLAQPVNRYELPQETTPMYTDPFGNTIGSSIR